MKDEEPPEATLVNATAVSPKEPLLIRAEPRFDNPPGAGLSCAVRRSLFRRPTERVKASRAGKLLQPGESLVPPRQK
jgi:hypothetical protein